MLRENSLAYPDPNDPSARRHPWALDALPLVIDAAQWQTVAAALKQRATLIDLVLRDTDATLVFVEVRQRSDARHGGAGASIGRAKQRRIVLAARHWLLRYAGEPPPCRFDAVLLDDAGGIEWLRAAFDAE